MYKKLGNWDKMVQKWPKISKKYKKASKMAENRPKIRPKNPTFPRKKLGFKWENWDKYVGLVENIDRTL